MDYLDINTGYNTYILYINILYYYISYINILIYYIIININMKYIIYSSEHFDNT